MGMLEGDRECTRWSVVLCCGLAEPCVCGLLYSASVLRVFADGLTVFLSFQSEYSGLG